MKLDCLAFVPGDKNGIALCAPMAAVLVVAIAAFLWAPAHRAGGAGDGQTDGQPDDRLYTDHLGRSSRQARLINFGSHHVRSEAD